MSRKAAFRLFFALSLLIPATSAFAGHGDENDNREEREHGRDNDRDNERDNDRRDNDNNSNVAQTNDNVECEGSCPNGKVMISGTLGRGRANCHCVNASNEDREQAHRGDATHTAPNTAAGDV